MSNTVDHTTSMRIKYATMTLGEFNDESTARTSAFLLTKLAKASQLLKQSRSKGMSNTEIAKELGLASSDAVYVMIKRWGAK